MLKAILLDYSGTIVTTDAYDAASRFRSIFQMCSGMDEAKLARVVEFATKTQQEF